jgi:hypothetical protein
MPHSLPSSFIARLAHLLPLALLACVSMLGCDTGGLGSDKAPVLKFQPEPPVFSFPKLRVGEAAMGADQSVQLQNIGEGNLVLVDFDANFNTDEFDLYYYVDAETDRQVNGIVDGQNSLGDRLVIEPGHSVTFVLSYQPTSDDVASGTFNFRSNDAKYANAEIEIVSEERAPEITVAPGELDFGRVAVGSTTDPQDVTITNIGQEVLLIDQLLLSGSGFTASIGDQDVTENPEVYVDPDGDGSPGLAPDASVVVQVRFSNTLEGPAEGLLSIMSNDPESPTVVVKLNANGASPCVRVSPTGDDGLMFGGVPLDGRLAEGHHHRVLRRPAAPHREHRDDGRQRRRDLAGRRVRAGAARAHARHDARHGPARTGTSNSSANPRRPRLTAVGSRSRATTRSTPASRSRSPASAC